MLAPINNYPGKIFGTFGFKHSSNNNFFTIPKRKPLTTKEHIGITTGSLLGTVLPLLLFSRVQKRSILKLKYSEKEMIMLSTGSITGGVLGGILSDRDTNPKYKIREGVFQFFNAVVPTLLIKPVLKTCENIKPLNNKKIKAGMLLGGIFGGMYAGAAISNRINGTNNTNEKRKVKFIDTIANIDVISGALIMAKFPLIEKLGLAKLLPLFYMWTGYESGISRENN